MSLRFKLLASILIATLAAWAVAAIRSYQDTRAEVDRLFDAHLVESAAALLKQASHEWRERKYRNAGESESDDDEDDEDHDSDGAYGISEIRARGELLEKRLMFEVRDANGSVLVRTGKGLQGDVIGDGFSTFSQGGVHLRVFSRWNAERTLRVIVAESVDARIALAKAAVRNILQPIMWMILPLLGVLVVIIEWSLRPIRRLSAEVGVRTANDLQPVDASRVPGELQSIVESLNSLFVRLARSFEHERRFTADAAHELRTPLAAIKVQAQVALREQDETRRNRALEATVAGVDRASHLVEQLLTLARLDPETALPVDTMSLRSILTSVLQEQAPAALAKSINLELMDGPDAEISGHRSLLVILVRNLLENAVRYTPDRGMVRVSTERGQGTVQFAVADTGPGLSREQMESLGRRFSRVQRPSGEGSGLGISIAMKIAAIHHARIDFANSADGPGLLVTVHFPLNKSALGVEV